MNTCMGMVFDQIAQTLGNGNARGLELACAIATRLRERGQSIRFSLLTAGKPEM